MRPSRFALLALVLLTQAEAREMYTDRPTRTETPITVEPGRAQLETSIFHYTNDEGDENYGLAQTTLLKVGVQKQIDAEFFFAGYNIGNEGPSGAGDLGLRLKANLFGNDQGDTALSLLAATSFPTGKREFRDASLGPSGYVVFQTKGPAEVELAITAGYQTRRPIDQARTSEQIGIVSLARPMLGTLYGFVEFYSSKDLHPGGEWQAAFDTGVYQKLGENLQLDAGIYLGLTEAADDLTPFAGLSFRL